MSDDKSNSQQSSREACLRTSTAGKTSVTTQEYSPASNGKEHDGFQSRVEICEDGIQFIFVVSKEKLHEIYSTVFGHSGTRSAVSSPKASDSVENNFSDTLGQSNDSRKAVNKEHSIAFTESGEFAIDVPEGSSENHREGSNTPNPIVSSMASPTDTNHSKDISVKNINSIASKDFGDSPENHTVDLEGINLKNIFEAVQKPNSSEKHNSNIQSYTDEPLNSENLDTVSYIKTSYTLNNAGESSHFDFTISTNISEAKLEIPINSISEQNESPLHKSSAGKGKCDVLNTDSIQNYTVQIDETEDSRIQMENESFSVYRNPASNEFSDTEEPNEMNRSGETTSSDDQVTSDDSHEQSKNEWPDIRPFTETEKIPVQEIKSCKSIGILTKYFRVDFSSECIVIEVTGRNDFSVNVMKYKETSKNSRNKSLKDIYPASNVLDESKSLSHGDLRKMPTSVSIKTQEFDDTDNTSSNIVNETQPAANGDTVREWSQIETDKENTHITSKKHTIVMPEAAIEIAESGAPEEAAVKESEYEALEQSFIEKAKFKASEVLDPKAPERVLLEAAESESASVTTVEKSESELLDGTFVKEAKYGSSEESAGGAPEEVLAEELSNDAPEEALVEEAKFRASDILETGAAEEAVVEARKSGTSEVVIVEKSESDCFVEEAKYGASNESASSASDEALVEECAGGAPDEALVEECAGGAPEEALVEECAGGAPEEALVEELANNAPEEAIVEEAKFRASNVSETGAAEEAVVEARKSETSEIVIVEKSEIELPDVSFVEKAEYGACKESASGALQEALVEMSGSVAPEKAIVEDSENKSQDNIFIQPLEDESSEEKINQSGKGLPEESSKRMERRSCEKANAEEKYCSQDIIITHPMRESAAEPKNVENGSTLNTVVDSTGDDFFEELSKDSEASSMKMVIIEDVNQSSKKITAFNAKDSEDETFMEKIKKPETGEFDCGFDENDQGTVRKDFLVINPNPSLDRHSESSLTSTEEMTTKNVTDTSTVSLLSETNDDSSQTAIFDDAESEQSEQASMSREDEESAVILMSVAKCNKQAEFKLNPEPENVGEEGKSDGGREMAADISSETDDGNSITSESEEKYSEEQAPKSEKMKNPGKLERDEVDCAPTRIRTRKGVSNISKDIILEHVTVDKSDKNTKVKNSITASSSKSSEKTSSVGKFLRSKSSETTQYTGRPCSTGKPEDTIALTRKKRAPTPDLKIPVRSSPRKITKGTTSSSASTATPKTPNTRSTAEAQAKSRLDTSVPCASTRRSKRTS